MLRKTTLLLLIICTIFISACSSNTYNNEKVTVTFSDAGWDSVKFHNAVAGYIGKHLYNIEPKTVMGSSSIVQAALVRGDIDVNMELWVDNTPSYATDMKTGKLVNLSINFDDDKQGFYVPRYVIEGDKKKGLQPLAPDLKTVKDLKRYAHIFKDTENPSKGRIYGAIPGWCIDQILYRKYQAYGLKENYIYFRPGSEAALNTAFISAYAKGEPIVGYNYEPTWVSGKLDLVLLEDAPYSPEAFEQGLTEARSVPVLVVANKQLLTKAPEFSNFLKNYHTSSALTAEALAYIDDTKADYEQAAIWFLKNHPELIAVWLPEDKAQKLNEALNTTASYSTSFLTNFPEQLKVDLTAPIDNFVKYINFKYSHIFNNLKDILSATIIGIENILNMIPWWLTIILTMLAGKKTSGSWRNGIYFGSGLLAIGIFGYWSMMNETLAVVISSVILSLLLGLPLGILISTNKTSAAILRPLLDAMQTMPTFVYMIPAVMLLGPGKVPAVLATVVYAVVPVIRLTSHGIQQVDPEIVEAAVSFGSSRWQTLFKVQIPQALPTIMTGVNQTMMMAIAMVVTCAMIGANGLGMEVLIAINRTESGRGFIAGISIVIIAIIIDRLTQSIVKSKKEHK